MRIFEEQKVEIPESNVLHSLTLLTFEWNFKNSRGFQKYDFKYMLEGFQWYLFHAIMRHGCE